MENKTKKKPPRKVTKELEYVFLSNTFRMLWSVSLNQLRQSYIIIMLYCETMIQFQTTDMLFILSPST